MMNLEKWVKQYVKYGRTGREEKFTKSVRFEDSLKFYKPPLS